MNLSGIFDIILQRHRTILTTEFPKQFREYFQKRYGATFDLDEKSGTCTVTRSDGDSIRFEPISYVEIFDTATKFCQESRQEKVSNLNENDLLSDAQL